MIHPDDSHKSLGLGSRTSKELKTYDLAAFQSLVTLIKTQYSGADLSQFLEEKGITPVHKHPESKHLINKRDLHSKDLQHVVGFHDKTKNIFHTFEATGNNTAHQAQLQAHVEKHFPKGCTAS